MLTKQQKADWIAALRSGEYQQGECTLQHGNSYCCLGVLAKINGLPTSVAYLLPKVHDKINLSTISENFSMAGNYVEIGIPPLEARGISYNDLAAANDQGVSFDEIADHLEKYLPTSD